MVGRGWGSKKEEKDRREAKSDILLHSEQLLYSIMSELAALYGDHRLSLAI